MATTQYTTAFCQKCQTVAAVLGFGRCAECTHLKYLRTQAEAITARIHAQRDTEP